MTDFFASQAGAGNMDGTSVADAWPEASIVWATVADNVLYLLGTITANFSVGAHSSAVGTPVQIRGDWPGNTGDVHVATGNAFTIPAATSRNNINVHELTCLSDNSNGIRLDSGAGILNRRFFNCISDSNSQHGVNFQTANGHDMDTIVFDGCSFDSNGSRGISCIVASGSSFQLDKLTINNCSVDSNTDDGVRINQEPGNTTSTFSDWTITDSTFNSNGTSSGRPGLRIGHFDGTHTNGKLVCTGNTANNNGIGTSGGGMLLQSFFTGGGIGSGGTYIANNTCNGNGGPNGGMNLFGCDGLVERNVCNNNTVSGSTIDGNGMIVDNNCDDLEVRYNECSGNLGSTAVNSGVGIMVLFDTSNIRVHHNYGDGNKYGLWTSHNESTQTQSDIEFTNNIFINCTDDGFHQGTAGSPLVNTVTNNLFTGASGSNFGMNNARSPDGEDLVADNNLYFGFETATYFQQAAGASDVITDPVLRGFQPTTESSAIDAGTPIATYTTDPDGQEHGQGGAWDIGAFEFTNAPIFSKTLARPLYRSIQHSMR